MNEYILEMQDIVKVFPGVKALKGVHLKVKPGRVHALMGENGAGKSTLMKCLIGIQSPTSGTIIYKGKTVRFPNTNTALKAGISMIHQELSPIPERSVMENVWVGREPGLGLWVDHRKMHKMTVDLFKNLSIDIDPCEKMGNLPVAKMQMIEIAKAVSFDSSIVIMDEPTSALTQGETLQLFKIIEQLKKKNVAIIYISHKMEEIFQICDDVTVYRDGEYVNSDKVENLTVDTLITLMVGREMGQMFPKVDCSIGDPILKVDKLGSGKLFRNVSFELRKGEILGIAGLVGAGRTEIVETLFGLHPVTSGSISKNGIPITIKSPRDAKDQKIALLTEDRRKTGIVGVLSVASNLTLANLKAYGLPLKYRKIFSDTEEYIKSLNIKTPDQEQQIQNLSGGNQQKVLIARWLLMDPDILLVDEPTRGIDVGAKAEIHTMLSKLAAAGKAIIMISSEMPEVLGMSDRILVMHEGEMTGIVDRSKANSELIMKYATGEMKEDRQK